MAEDATVHIGERHARGAAIVVLPDAKELAGWTKAFEADPDASFLALS